MRLPVSKSIFPALSVLEILLMIGTSSMSKAQGPIMPEPTTTQKTICENAKVTPAQCRALVFEFGSDSGKTLLHTSDLTTLTSPNGTQVMPDSQLIGDIVPLLQSNVRAAYVTYFNEQATTLAKSALAQAISTTSSVNQAGGPSSSAGSTNLVAKPKSTDFISLAAESGAFTETNNGSAITLQANADGLFKYFNNKAVFEWQPSDLATRLQPLNFAVTLNVAQSATSSVATNGAATTSTPASITSILLPENNVSLSAFTASYAVYQKYNPQDQKFSDAWESAVAKNRTDFQIAGSKVAGAVNQLFLDALQPAQLPDNLKASMLEWHTTGKQIEGTGTSDSDFTAFVSAYAKFAETLNKYLTSKVSSADDILALNLAVNAYKELANQVFSQARGNALATLNYTYSTPIQKPATHEFALVIADLFRGGKPQGANSTCETVANNQCRSFLSGAQFTGNFNASVYATLPAGAVYGRFRDVQMSAEFDKPFGGTLQAPRGTVSLAGYGQYQYDPTVLNITSGNLAPGTNIPLPADAQVLLGKAGWVGIVQGKLVITLKQGLNLPLAIKWSNRTDLIQANDVRGQIGLSYDLSALSKLLTGTK